MNDQASDKLADEATQPKPQSDSEEKRLDEQRGEVPAASQNPKDRNAEKSILQMAEFKVYVDLYKFFLRLSLSVNVFYLAVVGGLLTFLFRPVENQADGLSTNKLLIDTLIEPVKLVLLVTPFILSCVLTLSFAMGAWYWLISTLAINNRLKAEKVQVKLITRPFFHLLTWLLIAVTFIFMFVAFLLGRIMAEYGVLFCDGCSLRRARLPELVLFLLLASRMVNSLLLLIKYIERPTVKVKEQSEEQSEVQSEERSAADCKQEASGEAGGEKSATQD